MKKNHTPEISPRQFTDHRAAPDHPRRKVPHMVDTDRQRIMMADDIARITGLTPKTVNSVIAEYKYTIQTNPGQSWREAIDDMSKKLPANMKDETIVSVMAVFTFLRDFLPDEAECLTESLAEEAAFCMGLPDLPPGKTETRDSDG